MMTPYPSGITPPWISVGGVSAERTIWFTIAVEISAVIGILGIEKLTFVIDETSLVLDILLG
ncbi:MAG: hypothetical protein L7S54_04185 [Candidatus Thalassarchaeaceae archaeon]|nr:hypothetical protein [Candidatus Thalassarchaeaceae archaeon]